MNWNAGYVSEIEYTHGYYRELSPNLMRLACLSVGIAPSWNGPLRYLELGFGQGLSLNMHAAAVDGEFWGTDFNPNQAVQARALAEVSKSGAVILDESFAEFAARPDLPEFDVIALHGIWTWISDENRRIIIDLIRRKLDVGGVVYISYNCLPGWAPAMPLRHLMTLHADLAGSEASGILKKVNDALGFAQQVVDSGALYFRANPAVSDRLKKIAEQNRNYLAHEYFNLDWDIMSFSDIAKKLDDAKLSFVASSHLMDHVESVNLSEAGRQLLAGIQHPILRQSVRDYFVNQQFRRDLFTKGARRLTPLEQIEGYKQQAFVLLNHPDDVSMKVAGSLGEATLQEDIYRPLLEILAEDRYAPKTLARIAESATFSSRPFSHLIEAILVLTGAGSVNPAEKPSQDAIKRCAALNRFICQRARSNADVTFLASPITATGVVVPRMHQLFLLSIHSGKKSAQDHAQYAWDVLASQNQRLIKEGKTLESAEENLQELLREATAFVDKRLPLLNALRITF